MKLLAKIVLTAFLATAISFAGFCSLRKPAKILIFSKTTGYRHKSINAGIQAIRKMGGELGFSVDTTEDGASFTSRNLKKYRAIVFLSPTGNNILNEKQRKAFKHYIEKGGGFAGIHAATDCLFDWPWYGKLAGAYFDNHPSIQEAELLVTEREHPSTRHLPLSWKRTDEWYNFKNISRDIKVLLTINEKSYQGGKNGNSHPVAWYQRLAAGRAFYTALGHTEESYSDELFLKHLAGGILFAAGLE